MITNHAEKARIEAAIAAAKDRDLLVMLNAPTYGLRHSHQDVVAVRGTGFSIHKATDGSWVGYYARGILQHEEGVAAP